MNKNRTRNLGYRMLVALLSVSLVIAPAAGPAYAAPTPTPLADVPIAAKVSAKPNIVYTLDDSGSMQFNYLPDWVVVGAATTAVVKITRAGAVATVQVASTAALSVGQYVIIAGANQPEYDGEFQIVSIPNGTTFTIAIVGAPVTPATGTITYAIGTAFCRSGNGTVACTANNANYSTTFTSPPFYAAGFNRLGYDPNVNYTPPVKYDGTPLTHTIGTDTDAFGNQAFFAKVQTDPFTSPATNVNLTVAVAVPLYCNTDWPLTIGVNLAIADVGDVNGENTPPVAGKGDWCRINGTQYAAAVSNGAPAVLPDYNYPYKSSDGTVGTQYFFAQPTPANKVLWCDQTSPFFPHVPGATIIGCTLGGTPTCGGLPCVPVISQQKCNQAAKTCNPTVASRTWTLPVPPPCTASALYCAPNVGGSDGNSIGTGSAPECIACTCAANFQPAGGSCSITGAACTGPYGVLGGDIAQCPNQSATPAPNGCSAGVPIFSAPTLGTATCSGFTWDPVALVASNVSSPPGTTLLQDSNNLGVVCRHNNQSYAVSGVPLAGSTPYIYPRTNLNDVYAANKTGIAPYTQQGKFTTQASATGCPTVGATINIPRHYYTIDSVQFCNSTDITVNGQWRGFGSGACKPTNDLTNFQSVKYGQFHRVDLYPLHPPYPYIDQATQLPATRTYAQEIVNYGNWFAYYRLRSLAAKTTSALSFNLLDNTYRVGFHTLGSEPLPIGTGIAVTWVDVNDFNPGVGNQKNLWWNALFAVPTVTNYKTPSLSAMLRIGNLFETGGPGGLPATVASLPAGAKDPFAKNPITGQIISCQSNYHILFTDGATNQIALPAVAGDKDQAIPATLPPDDPTDPDKVLPDLRVPLWPAPFRQGVPAVSDTLSDIATYYWARDLRPALKDDVPAWSGKTPNDIDPTKDVAWWQHVNFSAISFGASGTLDVDNQPATLAAIQAGTVQWPNLTAPNNPPLPAGNKGAVAVDDLWHATVMARGSYVFATSPLEVQYGLASILAGISNQRKSRSGAAFSGQVLNATNDIIYEPTIEPGWGGDLLKVQIDPDPTSPTAGQEVATLWHAGAVLQNQVKPTFVGDEPWFDETKRRIVSWNGLTKVAFRAVAAGSMASVLSPAQLLTLSPDPLTQKKMVAYLRGGSTYTVPNPVPPPPNVVLTIEGTGIGQFRKRLGGILGDISNAQPLVVSAPSSPAIFNTAKDPGYAAYVATWNPSPALARPDQIVAAANDGMVHVFDVTDGHEVMGYVPSTLLRSTVDLSGKPTGLQALTYQDGGVPIYKHHFYVDASPRTSDVDFNSAGVKGGLSDWHTIVVGGLGKGGNSYYALDLTTPGAANETQAASKLLWEFTDATDWAYTYGRPVIIKTYKYGWVILVTSGYNNVSGEGRLYFLDPKTGAQVRPFLTTGPVSCLGPDGTLQTGGLAQISGFTKDFHNQYVEQVYGGDLCGNLWRFDLNDPAGAYVNPAKPFAILTDPSGNRQPITTAPQIEIDFANGIDRYVFIGTGRLLDTSDMTVPSPAQPQTMYAIRDGTLSTPIPAASPLLPIAPRATMAAVPPGGGPIAAGAPNGWYHDLPDGSGGTTPERIVIDVEADVNAVAYIGTQIPSDPCTIALPANIYVREYATATSLISDPTNGWFYHDNSGGVGLQIIGMQDPVTGQITLGGLLSHEIPGTKPVAINPPTNFGRNRFSWRLLTGE